MNRISHNHRAECRSSISNFTLVMDNRQNHNTNIKIYKSNLILENMGLHITIGTAVPAFDPKACVHTEVTLIPSDFKFFGASCWLTDTSTHEHTLNLVLSIVYKL